MKKALLYTVSFLFIQLLASTLLTVVLQLTGYGHLSQSPYVMIGSMVLFSVVTLVLFLRLHWAVVSPDYLRSRPRMVMGWSVVAALGTVIPSVFVQELMPELPNLVEQQLGDMMNAHGGYFVICLMAPLVEELVMRGAVLSALLQWQPNRHWAMIALSALLFALIHMNPAQMPHAFSVGLLLGWMYYRTGSIVPGVVYHWANNTVAYFLFRLYPDPHIHLIDILGSQQRVLMAVAFSLLILLPAVFQLNVWMRRR